MTAFDEIVRGTSRKPHHLAIRALARGFDAANEHLWWSHNDHFHGWVLRRLRAARGPAVVVDVGCGAGALVAAMRARGLAPVVGIDPDELMARTAAERFADDAAVTIEQASFFDLARGAGPVPPAGVGGITMVASLHHLAHERGLEASLAHARELLASGGRLLVVGLARGGVPADFAVDAVSVVLNPAMGALKAVGRRSGRGAIMPGPASSSPGAESDTADRSREDGMPVRNPDETFTQVVAAAAAVLPGARVRRRLWFRYTLEWTAP